MDRRLITTDHAIERVDRLRELRSDKGLSMDDFTILTPLTDAFMPEHYERAEASGIDGIITMPWMFYAGPKASRREDRRHEALPKGPGARRLNCAIGSPLANFCPPSELRLETLSLHPQALCMANLCVAAVISFADTATTL